MSVLCRCFARLKREASQLHIIFMEELSYVLAKNLLLVFLFAFIFFTAANYSFSHRSYVIVTLFFQRNQSPLVLVTLSSSFSVIHVMSVDIKFNVEKDSTLFKVVFPSRSPGCHAISRQKHLEFPVVSYLFIELLLCLWCGRTDGR